VTSVDRLALNLLYLAWLKRQLWAAIDAEDEADGANPRAASLCVTVRRRTELASTVKLADVANAVIHFPRSRGTRRTPRTSSRRRTTRTAAHGPTRSTI
jgi:hypothetical protein